MRIWRSIQARLTQLFRRQQAEDDLSSELEAHLENEIRRNVASGLSASEARLLALRSIGGTEQVKELCREVRTGANLDKLIQDVRYGWRAMLHNPLFSTMAILSLALGIGANTAIYSLLDSIMVRALPVKNANELVILNWRQKGKEEPPVIQSHSGTKFSDAGGGSSSPDLPWPLYRQLREHNNVFSTLFGFKREYSLNLMVQGRAEIGQVEFVTGNFFSGLALTPAAGRLIDDSDNRPGSPPVAVISYQYWQGRFGGEASAIGQPIAINRLPFTIAGVAPAEFFGVSPGSAITVYLPMVNRPALSRNYGNEHDTMFQDAHNYWVDVMGRLRPGATLAQAQSELGAQFHRFALDSAAKDSEKTNLPALWVEEGGSGIDSLRREYSKPLLILMTMVAFILAIACANIANLLLTRATSRRREIAVRLSVGAGRGRIVRQLLTESLMLAIPGAVLGLGIAGAGIRFLTWLMAAGRRDDFSLNAQLDSHVLAFTAGITILAGLLFGLFPALAATRLDVTPALKETRASAPRHAGGRLGVSQALVIAQIALSLVLVLGAVIFVRTLVNLRSVAAGFNRENLLTFRLDASQAGYKDAALRSFYAELTERLRGLPGVRAATMADLLLVTQSTRSTNLSFPGVPKVEGRFAPNTAYLSVGPDFFSTMQIPVMEGRAIDAHDNENAPHVALVNEVFARKYFPSQNALGRQFTLGSSNTGDVTIVGIAKNVLYNSLKEKIPPVVYIPALQKITNSPPIGMAFELRTSGNPQALADTVRKLVHNIAPQVPVTQMKTHAQLIDDTIVQERTFADLCSAFALLALAIACVGLYGTMAYGVARRTNEIGIRMALGAERGGIVWMIQREVLILAVAGLVIGSLCAWASISTIKTFIFGMKLADPLTMTATAGILVTAAILAGLAPAIRASRIDPLAALRHE